MGHVSRYEQGLPGQVSRESNWDNASNRIRGKRSLFVPKAAHSLNGRTRRVRPKLGTLTLKQAQKGENLGAMDREGGRSGRRVVLRGYATGQRIEIKIRGKRSEKTKWGEMTPKKVQLQ